MKLYNTKRGLLVESDGKFYKTEAANIDLILGGKDILSVAQDAVMGSPVSAPTSTKFWPQSITKKFGRLE